MKFKIDTYNKCGYKWWGVWQNEKGYRKFNPLEVFAKYDQAFEYWRQLEFNT